MSEYKPAQNKSNHFHLTLDGEDTHLSPGLRALASEFADRMIEEYESRKQGIYDLLKRYPNDEGLKEMWTPEKIEAYANRSDQPHAIEKLRGTPFYHIKWEDLMAARQEDHEQAIECYQAIYERAGDYVRAGILASHALDLQMPFERGQFSFVRLSFRDEWQPRGGIESSMVDTLAQCYVAWQYWLKRSFEAANCMDSVREQVKKAKNKPTRPGEWDDGAWQPPRITGVEYLDHCTQMADRFNRMFLRVLRQMRDLRRYSVPVTINNPKQVNIAADGGQQVNVQNKAGAKSRKRKRASNKPQRILKDAK